MSRFFHTPLSSSLHSQRAGFDRQQVLEHFFPSHLLTLAAAGRQAGSLLPPLCSCCWGTAVLLSPLHAAVPGCFLLLAGQKDGRMFLHQDDSCPKPPLSAESPPAASPSGFQPPFYGLCAALWGETLKQAPNPHPTLFSYSEEQDEAWRAAWQVKPQAQGGGMCWELGSLSSAEGMDEHTRCFLGFTAPSKTALLPPHCKT